MGFSISEEVFAQMMQCGIVLVSGLIINSILRSLIKVPLKFDNRQGRTYATVFRNTISLIIGFVLLYALFRIWKIDIAPLLASAGIIGIVVGIGSRSFFEDLIAGIFLIPETKIAIGDFINLGGNIEGTVESIGLRSITLISTNGAYTVVPTGQIKQVTNMSFGKAQVTLDIYVKPGQSPDVILNVFKDVLESYEEDEHPKLLKGSKVIGVTKIDRAYIVSSLLISEPSLRGKIEPDFNKRIIKAFVRNKLQFA